VVTTRMEDIVEHVKLEAPEAEPLRLELESFLRRGCAGDRDGRGHRRPPACRP